MRFAALIAAFAACTSSPNFMRPYTPASGHTDKAIEQASNAIVSAGYEVDSSTSTLVASRWFEGMGLGGTIEYRLVVTLNAGNYRVEAQCRATGSAVCSTDRRPQFVLDAIARVAQELQ